VRKAKQHTGIVPEYRWSAFLGGGALEPASGPSKGGAPSPDKAGAEPAPSSSKTGVMLDAASKQLHKRASRG